MNAAELKSEIFKPLNSLENNKIKEFYGLVLNFVNGQNDIEEWHTLSEEQRQGLLAAEEQIKKGNGIAHLKIVDKYNKKLLGI
ncbi:MAG: hypothetical protein EAY66_05875 [Sphingobacteriales bacterium]|nr:MAG: hypothetical protein EAY66_05875 [Sphingobacteriales bacterium]